MKSLKESLFDDDLVSKDVIDPKYTHPKNKIELRESIKYYIELTNPKIGDTIDLNWIDVSEIIDMSCLFDDYELNKYNFKISKWKVDKVRNMAFMFNDCKYFNCNISKWNVSNVRNMNFMFGGCKKFDCDLSKWNVIRVVTNIDIFQACPKMKEENKPHFK